MKKIILIVGLILIINLPIFIIINNKTNKNSTQNIKNAISIMVYDNNANEYIRQSDIPKGSYVLNKEKSKCQSGGEITNYNSVNGTVSYSLAQADVCSLYFDYLEKIVFSFDKYTCEAEQGMSWEKWITSDYYNNCRNNYNPKFTFEVDYASVCYASETPYLNFITINDNNVMWADIIIANTTYSSRSDTGGFGGN